MIATKNIVWVFQYSGDKEDEQLFETLCRDVYAIYKTALGDDQARLNILEHLKANLEAMGAKQIYRKHTAFTSIANAKKILFDKQPFMPIICFYIVTDENKEEVFQELQKHSDIASVIISKDDEIYGIR